MNRKLNAATAQSIIHRVTAGERQQDLAAEFKVSPAAISNLVAGKSWPELHRTPTVRPPPRGSKLTVANIQVILQRLMTGEKPGTVALDYGVTRQAIANVKKGAAWVGIPRPEATRPARRRVWEG
jgi:uncharacterized protein (DUF433 family)